MSATHYVALQSVPLELRSMVAPVLFQSRETGSWKARGSSFCIVPPTRHAQAVYVTARHVVDSLVDSQDANPYLLLPNSTSADRDKHLVRVPVDSISLAKSDNDVALLRADLRKVDGSLEGPSIRTAIALRPPEVAENTLALGYPHQVVTDSFSFESELRASHGVVEEIHNEKRDPLVTYPSFMVSGRYEAGMSGGPVYDEKGGVIGVVSRGMTPSDGSPPYGIAASIGCLTELRVTLETDDAGPFDYSMGELSRIGLVKLLGAYGVTLDRNESGLRLRWIAAPTQQ